MEIERKFLLKKIPESLKINKSVEIEQYYICREKDKIVRIRRMANVFNIGIKKGGGMSRFEKEIKISKQDFDELKNICRENKIFKIRHIIISDKYKFEIDEFKDSLEGLLLVEVEFQSEKEANKFIPPSWFGKEVTGNHKYSNSYLSESQSIP